MSVVVFGWGNESRGDDGLGPALMRRIETAALAGVNLIEDYQLQIEHALDLEGADLALFIDAGKDTPAPYVFTSLAPSAGLSHTSHALAPEQVLAVYRQVKGAEPPPAFQLCVKGERFELGEGLSEAALVRLEAAWELIVDLLGAPVAEAWLERV